MRMLIVIFVMAFMCCAATIEEDIQEVVPRGKGVKYALISHFLYVVATKVVFLKIIYGALFFALIYKGWHFMLWFIHYLKKKEHHIHIDDHHYEHDHVEHSHFDHGQFDHGHSDYYASFDSQPYSYDKYGYGSDYKKRIYDADGSYSVKLK